MKNQKIATTDNLTQDDILSLVRSLWVVGREYKGMFYAVTEYMRKNDGPFSWYISLGESGLSISDIEKQTLTVSLDPPFEAYSYTFETPVDVEYKFEVWGEIAKDKRVEVGMESEKSENDDTEAENIDAESLFRKKSKIVNSLYRYDRDRMIVSDALGVDLHGAIQFLDIFGDLMQFYLSPIDSLIRGKVAVPAFANNHYDSLIFEFEHGKDLDKIADELQQNMKVSFQRYEAMLGEIKRIAFQRMPQCSVKNVSQKIEQQRVNPKVPPHFIKVFKEAIITLSGSRDFDMSAPNVFSYMQKLDRTIKNRRFSASDMSNAKRALIDNEGMQFIGKTCRLTDDCLSQVGKKIPK